MRTEYPNIPFAVVSPPRPLPSLPPPSLARPTHCPRLTQDFVSTDDYGSINDDPSWNASQIKRHTNAPYQYKRYLYPKMYPHQRPFMIPPMENMSFWDCHGPGECESDIDGIPGQCPP